MVFLEDVDEKFPNLLCQIHQVPNCDGLIDTHYVLSSPINALFAKVCGG